MPWQAICLERFGALVNAELEKMDDRAVAAQTRAHLGSSSVRCESSWNITKCGRAMCIRTAYYTIHTYRVQKHAETTIDLYCRHTSI